MSKKHKLTSESKPCIQEAGGGIPLEVQTNKILETKHIGNINSTNILNEVEQQRHKTIDPSLFKNFIDSICKKYTTTGKDDHKKKDTSSDPKNQMNQTRKKRMEKCIAIMLKELVTRVENVYSDTSWNSYIEISNEKCSQSAFAIICMEDNTLKIFDEVRPYIPTKKCQRTNHNTNTRHSEEILLDDMNTFLAQDKKVKWIFLNSYNSPCFERDDQIEGCMFLILSNAYEWYVKYDAITVLTYTKPWGLCGPGYFNELSSKDIMNPKSPFKSCVEEYEIRYELDCENLNKKLKNNKILKQYSCGEDSKNIKFAREALVELAAELPRLRKAFLELGDKKIDSFIFLSEKIKPILKKLWRENVNNSFVSLLKEYITTIFNKKVVDLFTQELESQLGISSFIQLHQLPPVKLKDEYRQIF
ncbi:uncharacterized protein LOC113035833 [Astatotilapia calliptera]|uniref:uncharacterized protein LOC113035833 n=1 Tax=Astatotilapia calliptera TaxID=8154 RepID=UPI000E409D3C|nr:uncharacterized protein LOC113035833 [Astatotilapia calliptera]